MQQLDLRSWSLGTETAAPSWWTWSEPAAGPAPPAGDARWTAPDHCRCCLRDEQTERGEGWMDRREEGDERSERVVMLGVKDGEKKGREDETDIEWMQADICGGVTYLWVYIFNRRQEGKRAVQEK